MRPLLGSREKILQQALQIGENFIVPIADDDDIFFQEKTSAALVCMSLLRGMLSAIKFYGQPKTRAKEIKRVAANWMLSPELQAAMLATSERKPKPNFGIRHVAA